MKNSYFPTANMVRKAFESHGFTEYKSIAELRIGGYVFFRRHADGRLQSAYVFPWSNFQAAIEKGIAPCLLHVRINTNVDQPESEAWKTAMLAPAISIPFEQGQWPVVTDAIAEQIIPVYDAPQDEQQLSERTPETGEPLF